jgi:hypothetical protein
LPPATICFDLLVDVLADLRLEHVAVLGIPRESLRIAMAVRVDLAERVGRASALNAIIPPL